MVLDGKLFRRDPLLAGARRLPSPHAPALRRCADVVPHIVLLVRVVPALPVVRHYSQPFSIAVQYGYVIENKQVRGGIDGGGAVLGRVRLLDR